MRAALRRAAIRRLSVRRLIEPPSSFLSCTSDRPSGCRSSASSMRCSSVVVTLLGMILPHIWRESLLFGKLICILLFLLYSYVARNLLIQPLTIYRGRATRHCPNERRGHVLRV